MVWTRFMDMHSGGGQKLDWPYIYIEAPEREARAVFWSRFGRDPRHATCPSCGDDYGVDEAETLEQASAFERRCRYDEKARRYVEEDDPRYAKYGDCHVALDAYLASGRALAIRASEISPGERRTELPDFEFDDDCEEERDD